MSSYPYLVVEALIGVIVVLMGKLIVDHFKIATLEREVQETKAVAKKDADGIGSRQRNAEWERYKLQIMSLADEANAEERRWMVEQFLKR